MRALALELADVVIYLDLLEAHEGMEPSRLSDERIKFVCTQANTQSLPRLGLNLQHAFANLVQRHDIAACDYSPSLHLCFAEVKGAVLAIALHCDIALPLMVVEKFNMVSEMRGCDIKLSYNLSM